MQDNNGGSSYMDDINKYAAMWDAALESGIMKINKPKKSEESEDSFFGSDFFGQNNNSEEYDIDAPLNEVDTKYWAEVCKLADPNRIDETKDDVKKAADAMAKAHNPIGPNTVGKDQEPNVAQNWGVGGKEHFQLEELKVRLEKLESELNALDAKNSKPNPRTKLDELKKQIDELSDSLDGERFSSDG